MERGDRSGQFYLIAGIVVAAILIGIITVTNFSERGSDLNLLDVKEELEIESRQVLDYASFNNQDEAQTEITVNDFTTDYISHRKSEHDIYFVYGDRQDLDVKGYQDSAKEVRIVSGTASSTVTSSSGDFSGGVNPGNANEAILYIDDNSYTFKLNEGENFYFVVSRGAGGGEFVVSG